MMKHNVKLAGRNAPALGAKFYVTAVCDIPTPRHLIRQGSHVLIDPNAAPNPGGMVLSAGNLAPWSGQESIDGVALMISVPLIDVAATRGSPDDE